MESMTGFASVFLWIAMFFAIGFAVIYMVILAHGIMQDPNNTTYTKLKKRFKNTFRREKQPASVPIDIKGIKTDPKWNAAKHR